MFLTNISDFRKVFGPAWLVMMADVDAASIITAMQTGAVFKYEFILILVILIVPLYFICEVAGRVGAVTKQGLGELIRKHFSRKVSIALSFPMAITDFLSYLAEYAAIGVGLAVIGIPPLISLPVVYIIHILVLFKKEYKTAEKYLLAVSLVMFFAYIIFMSKGITSDFSLLPSNISKDFLFLIAANVGAVIMPFMLFYQTTATAKKDFHSVQATRIETLAGAVCSQLVMIAIVIVSAKLNTHLAIIDANSLRNAITGLGGTLTPLLFAAGLTAAGFLALIVISLASAWGVVESLGIKGNMWFKVYILESVPALIVVFLFQNLIGVILTLMVAMVFVLIGPVVAMGILAQNRKLMGKHALNRFDRFAYWGSVGSVIFCGLLAFL